MGLEPQPGRAVALTRRRLWLAVLIGPLAWLVFVQTAYALVPSACTRPTGVMLFLQGAAALALALSSAGIVAAWQAWQRADRSAPSVSTASARTRFIALAGIGAIGLLVLIVVAGALPLLLLAPCA
jgi:hypothetical protein